MSADAVDEALAKKIKSVTLKSDINILLLGETGVGKSTFINAMANYLNFRDIKNAEKNDLLVLIPSEFTIVDKHFEKKTVYVGNKKDANEHLKTGESATQDVQTYVFPIYNGTANVRLIDTPGLTDTRGIVQDEENCENILTYLSKLHELHAICILLKPTNTRITVGFEYCIKKILSHLDKSAAKNIIFCFTNTRGSNYTPGETLPCIERVIDDIKNNSPNVEIPFVKNKFCFDNEAFRFLAAVKNGVEFDDNVRITSTDSWKKSTNECWNMLKYIVPLTPHMVKNTISINETRRLISHLSQPMMDISQNIENNIRLSERHKIKIAAENQTLEELQENLYMPVINLQATKLTQPVTVCANKSCIDVIKVEGINSTHYKTRCHDPCYLTNVQKELIGDCALIHCAAMDSNTKTCKKCSCSFMVHMHIYYMTKKVSDRVIDKNIQANINNRQAIMQEVQNLIRKLEIRVLELRQEHEQIVRAAALFAHFLQKNAITPYNDAYANYIDYLINREQSLGSAADQLSIRHLNDLKHKYDEMKSAFQHALLNKIGDHASPKAVKETIEELFKLKHCGKKINDLYKSQKVSRKKEHEHTEYIHKMTIQKTDLSDDQQVLNIASLTMPEDRNSCTDNSLKKRSYRNNNDCYFFYYSTCAKGDSCTYRHEPLALGCETVCRSWKKGTCADTHCRFRHMKLEKNRPDIECYWESRSEGCLKAHCPFKHRNKTSETDDNCTSDDSSVASSDEDASKKPTATKQQKPNATKEQKTDGKPKKQDDTKKQNSARNVQTKKNEKKVAPPTYNEACGSEKPNQRPDHTNAPYRPSGPPHQPGYYPPRQPGPYPPHQPGPYPPHQPGPYPPHQPGPYPPYQPGPYPPHQYGHYPPHQPGYYPPPQPGYYPPPPHEMTGQSNSSDPVKVEVTVVNTGLPKDHHPSNPSAPYDQYYSPNSSYPGPSYPGYNHNYPGYHHPPGPTPPPHHSNNPNQERYRRQSSTDQRGRFRGRGRGGIKKNVNRKGNPNQNDSDDSDTSVASHRSSKKK